MFFCVKNLILKIPETKMGPINSRRAQAMPYFFMMVFVLVLCWAMMINVAKLVKDRMMMQNAADNAAISVAVLQARVLNVIGSMNYLIATTLASGAYPAIVHINLYNQHYVGSALDRKCSGGLEMGKESYEYVSKLRNLVVGLTEAQKKLVEVVYPAQVLYVANKIAERQEYNAKKEATGADIAICAPLTIEGLKQNEREIVYYTTVNWGVGPIPFVLNKHVHFVLPKEYKREKYSWYYVEDNDKFSKRKVTVTVIKKSDSASNKGYPLFGKWFGIEWPAIYATASAAVYNVDGRMYPKKADDSTGMPPELIPVASALLAKQLKDMGELAAEVGKLPVIGPALGGIVGALAATVAAVAGVSVALAITSDDTPVKTYNTAKEGGWDAQLVPVGGAFIH